MIRIIIQDYYNKGIFTEIILIYKGNYNLLLKLDTLKILKKQKLIKNSLKVTLLNLYNYFNEI